MDSIYKYTSLENAYLTICNNSVGLNHPQNYNDPFDCAVDIDDKDIKKCIAILSEYFLSLEMLKLINNKDIRINPIMKPIMKLDRFIINTNLKVAAKTKYYDPNPMLYGIAKFAIQYAAKKSNVSLNEMKDNFAKETIGKVREERDKVLISCFGKKWDSILMWAHYGDKHRGICIEFERPEKDFVDVKYSKKRCKLDIADITRRIIGYQIAEQKLDPNDKGVIKCLVKPFIVKSLVWQYEEEVRCILSKNTEGVYTDENGNDLYKMPTGIKKIYVGCKVDRKDKTLVDLLSKAKEQEIPVVFLKASDDNFKLLPDISNLIDKGE